MDIPRLIIMQEYWAENPPLHILVKGFMGYKGKPSSINKDSSSNKLNEEKLESMMLNMPQANNNNRIKPRMI